MRRRRRRRRRRWDHDEDVCGCRGRSIHRMTGMGGGLVLSSLLFPPPHLKLPPRDIYICIPHSISTPLSSHRKKNSTLLCVMSLSDINPEFCNMRKCMLGWKCDGMVMRTSGDKCCWGWVVCFFADAAGRIMEVLLDPWSGPRNGR